MPAGQQDFVLKYYLAGQGGGYDPLQWVAIKDKSVRQMKRAATKRAMAVRAIRIVKMCDCLEGIEPCECIGRGHQLQRLGW
jgi:hypothetical protein